MTTKIELADLATYNAARADLFQTAAMQQAEREELAKKQTAALAKLQERLKAAHDHIVGTYGLGANDKFDTDSGEILRGPALAAVPGELG